MGRGLVVVRIVDSVELSVGHEVGQCEGHTYSVVITKAVQELRCRHSCLGLS